jgi:hypothetical protein
LTRLEMGIAIPRGVEDRGSRMAPAKKGRIKRIEQYEGYMSD